MKVKSDPIGAGLLNRKAKKHCGILVDVSGFAPNLQRIQSKQFRVGDRVQKADDQSITGTVEMVLGDGVIVRIKNPDGHEVLDYFQIDQMRVAPSGLKE